MDQKRVHDFLLDISLKEQDKGVYRKSRNGEWVNAKDISMCICCCFHCSHGLCL
ncbi:hypothetical protein ES332_A08G127900v1 [Gossypium tomentosum]|uniref:Uncharacterized protein n=1 Tax=Gossypium tomentosum TaxID=34277 RepID=A0A5D2PGT4_GOSTO|nr:hypothetical protein ES332_A08G127900v1 [Gossypium tomentosum]